MRIPSGKDVQSSADEWRRDKEFFTHEEFQKAKENPSSQELFRSNEVEELQEKKKSLPNPQINPQNLTLLSSTGMGLSAVVASVTVVAVAMAPTVLSKPLEDGSEVVLPQPTFTITREEIGLDFFRGQLLTENVEGATLYAILEDVEGNLLAEVPLDQEGNVAFEDLVDDSSYTLSVTDGEGVELFSHSFVTESYIKLIELTDGTGAKIVFHSSIDTSLAFDAGLSLYDVQGKDFSSNLYMEAIYGEVEGATDSDSATIIGYENFLVYYGLYEGEYELRLTTYESERETVYKKRLYMEGLTPLAYTATVEEGTAVLQYQSGDLGAYDSFFVEWYQGEEYVGYENVTANEDGTLTVPFAADMASGTYTLRLFGENAERGLYNEIWKTEIIL